MKGIGAIVIVGLVVWWLTQRQKQAQAAELLPGQTYPTEYGESEYEKLHKVVPITASTSRLFEVYGEETG